MEPCRRVQLLHEWHGYTAFGQKVPLRGTEDKPKLCPILAKRRIRGVCAV